MDIGIHSQTVFFSTQEEISGESDLDEVLRVINIGPVLRGVITVDTPDNARCVRVIFDTARTDVEQVQTWLWEHGVKVDQCAQP
jgi:hypothetical protein